MLIVKITLKWVYTDDKGDVINFSPIHDLNEKDKNIILILTGHFLFKKKGK